jgi:hypothetical protein
MGGDYYVSGGVNWAGFTLEQLISMVADKASVPQLERLAEDWRDTGDGVVDAADLLAEALDDLMDFWSGESADQARNKVALNAQWVGDLGLAAKDMGTPIDEAAGALKAAQEAMPKLPAVLPAAQPGAAPHAAREAADLTGSPLGAAVGGTAAGSQSAFEAQAQQEELKRVAVETMQRFEAAAVGIDRATPQLPGQSTELRPRVEDPDHEPGSDLWLSTISMTSNVDLRWQLLTNQVDPGTSAQSHGGSYGGGGGGGGFGGGGSFSGVAAGTGGGAGVRPGPLAGRATPGEALDRSPGQLVGRAGSAPNPMGTGMHAPMGAAPLGAGMGSGAGNGEGHRRRFPFDAEDPFDTGQKASPPVIGL